MPDSRRGLTAGALAYTLWGIFPLYWTILEPAGAIELLAHRIIWSVVTMVAILVLWGRVDQFRALLRDRRKTLIIAVAAVVITVCLLYTSPSPRDRQKSRMPSSA